MDGAPFLSFEVPDPATSVPLALDMPEPETSYPNARMDEEYFWSWADLENVSQVAVCHAETRDHITGLLLMDATRRRTAVGMIRLEYLGQLLPVDPSSGFWLCFRHRKLRVDTNVMGVWSGGTHVESECQPSLAGYD
ncbi:hypothetical protein NQ176_g5899 [Zarea fungicola]|uniref:Uncharacterized protein n=1 Tax=Zarea fungicola TaxID=93591 RepID=A0ACC1N751_9HYPO|nr:hypothetical protein NQ176_g5899 [Lecanicillium fungicola]